MFGFKSRNPILYGWKLDEENLVEKWKNEIRPTIQAIIQRNPSMSRTESSPTLHLHGLKVGEKVGQADAKRSIVVCCKSKLYREQILQVIRQSKVLDRWNFQIMAMEYPIRYE